MSTLSIFYRREIFVLHLGDHDTLVRRKSKQSCDDHVDQNETSIELHGFLSAAAMASTLLSGQIGF